MLPTGNDQSWELMSLVALVVLNALDSFRYVLIAAGLGAALMGVSFLCRRSILRATMVNGRSRYASLQSNPRRNWRAVLPQLENGESEFNQ
jgi:hypothetical protein